MTYFVTTPDGDEIEISGNHRSNMVKYPPRYVVLCWENDRWETIRWTSSLQVAVSTARSWFEAPKPRTFIAFARSVDDEAK